MNNLLSIRRRHKSYFFVKQDDKNKNLANKSLLVKRITAATTLSCNHHNETMWQSKNQFPIIIRSDSDRSSQVRPKAKW